MQLPRRHFLSCACAIGSAALAARSCYAEEEVQLPRYRIDPRDFDASEADIRAVCDSAGKQLWRHFPDYELEPLVVAHGDQGPITLFQRNDQKEVVLKLDVEGTFWSQFAYQFAHEFCHVLCGFREAGRANLWFEEAWCETASLFALRGMAREWRDAPPYKHWADYRDHLRGYADDVIRKREHLPALHRQGLAAFWKEHAAELTARPTDRELTGAIGVVLLHRIEREPARWEALRWLNAEAAPPGEAFGDYLARWRKAVPERHAAFVGEVAEMFGMG